jgi:hypothetical protein
MDGIFRSTRIPMDLEDLSQEQYQKEQHNFVIKLWMKRNVKSRRWSQVGNLLKGTGVNVQTHLIAKHHISRSCFYGYPPY